MMQAEMKVQLADETMNDLYAQIYVVTQQAIQDAQQASDKLFYTQNEAMEILRCGREQLQKYYALGLPSIEQGRQRLIYKQDLIDFMRNLAN